MTNYIVFMYRNVIMKPLIFFPMVPEFEHRALHWLGRHSNNWVSPPALKPFTLYNLMYANKSRFWGTVLRVIPRDLHMWGKCSVTELCHLLLWKNAHKICHSIFFLGIGRGWGGSEGIGYCWSKGKISM
jgi:hypothetical protein